MKYLIRIFTEDDENVMAEYHFDTMPYMPNIGETITVKGGFYKILSILSSFDRLGDIDGTEFMIDYTVEEVDW